MVPTAGTESVPGAHGAPGAACILQDLRDIQRQTSCRLPVHLGTVPNGRLGRKESNGRKVSPFSWRIFILTI